MICLTIGNIKYLIVNALMISGVLYVSIYSLVFKNKRIVELAYNNKPTFTTDKNGSATNIPIKSIRAIIREKVTFFVGMIFSAMGAFLQCVLELEKIQNDMAFTVLLLTTIVIFTVLTHLLSTIVVYIKTNIIVKELHNGKLKPDVSESAYEY